MPDKGIKRLKVKLPTTYYSIAIVMKPYTYEYRTCQAPFMYYYKAIRDFAKCPVCMNFWSAPMSLPCGHMLCQGCVNRLVEQALDDTQEAYAAERLSQIEPEIDCPKCGEKTSIESISVADRANPAMAGISLNLSKILAFSPVHKCAHCDGTRCFAGSTDYCLCETCNSIAYPLCALDLHRNHDVRIGYMLGMEKLMAFSKAFNVSRSKLTQMLLEHDTLRTNSQHQHLLNYCKIRLDSLIAHLSTLLKPTQETYSKMIRLEFLYSGEYVVRDREETLQLFEAEIMTLKESIASECAKIKRLANVFEKSEFAYAETPTAQLVPESSL